MNETQKNYILVTQAEELKKKFNLDCLLEMEEFFVPNHEMGPEKESEERIYGVKDGSLIRVRNYREEYFAREKVGFRPYASAVRDMSYLSLGVGGLSSLFWGMGKGFEYLTNQPLEDFKVVPYLALFAGLLGMIKFFPSAIKEARHESKILKKHKASLNQD